MKLHYYVFEDFRTGFTDHCLNPPVIFSKDDQLTTTPITSLTNLRIRLITCPRFSISLAFVPHHTSLAICHSVSDDKFTTPSLLSNLIFPTIDPPPSPKAKPQPARPSWNSEEADRHA